MKTKSHFVITLMVGIAIFIGGNNSLRAQDYKSWPVFSDADPPVPKEITQWIEQTLKDVKEVNVVACLNYWGQIPDWLKQGALEQDSLTYISSKLGNRITYADGKQHDPKIQGCNDYSPFLDDPGNLNFIVKVLVRPVRINNKDVSVAQISRVVYRPGYRTSVFSFLSARGQMLDLSDPDKAHKNYDLDKNLWTFGYSFNPAYDK
ncbi:MAG TPA: hypothetical protein VL625_06575 [Patescibacteria group bacterium]|jgi:hypothetical protein|nr:hypothetical protein [Patescibacteria group bacterium]